MTIWRPDLEKHAGPVYRQISDAIGKDISSGKLVVGDRLPVQRDLAYTLGISLNTVSRAYADATTRGYLQGEVGRGTWVRAAGAFPVQSPQTDLIRRATGPIDFSLNLPVPGMATKALAQTLATLNNASNLSVFLDDQTQGDQKQHTIAGAKWLSRVGLEADPENIILTTGAQQGIMVAMLATMRPGDVMLTEALTYGPIKALAQHLGIKIIPVGIDEGGLSAEDLDAVCQRVAAKTLYCMPTLHTPTTTTMSAERREAVTSIARKHDLLIIEDDVFGFLPVKRPLPLASFAPERTIYITSVSKSLAPGLRVGYLHAPDHYTNALRAAVNISCWMPPPLMADIASKWIDNGTADSLSEYQRSEATVRQSLARQILPEKYLKAEPNGFHLWLDLPSGWHADTFRTVAEQQGVKVLTAEIFSVDQTNSPPAIRLCLSHEASRERVTKGLQIIANILSEPRDPGAFIL
ncbi:MAG: PLP-dependent aminotransferase family protein [Halopseudomonas aestusnigri]